MTERIKLNGEEKPSLIIFDLNHVGVKPLSLIPKLKSKLKKTSVIGFLSHVQGDLKQKRRMKWVVTWFCRARFRRICRSCCVATEQRKSHSLIMLIALLYVQLGKWK